MCSAIKYGMNLLIVVFEDIHDVWNAYLGYTNLDQLS